MWKITPSPWIFCLKSMLLSQHWPNNISWSVLLNLAHIQETCRWWWESLMPISLLNKSQMVLIPFSNPWFYHSLCVCACILKSCIISAKLKSIMRHHYTNEAEFFKSLWWHEPLNFLISLAFSLLWYHRDLLQIIHFNKVINWYSQELHGFGM